MMISIVVHHQIFLLYTDGRTKVITGRVTPCLLAERLSIADVRPIKKGSTDGSLYRVLSYRHIMRP